MKWLAVLALFAGVIQPASADQPLRLMTYNIRLDVASDGANAWPHRRQWVADEHGRVHGLANLYVSGGSVFPTSGATMLTVNIIAMTVRLADHLRTKLIRAGEMHVT